MTASVGPLAQSFGLTVSPENVLGIRAVVLQEAHDLQNTLADEGRYVMLAPLGHDPVSGEMSTAFNPVTHDLFQRVTDHINSLLALCAELAATVPTAPPPGNGLPPRPATLRIAGVDPCTLLTQAQVSQLGVNAGHRNDYQPGRPLQGTVCEWSTDELKQRIGYGGSLVTNRGADFALGAEPLRTVGGYAATTTGSALFEPQWYCVMLVDVAPEQSLLVDFNVQTQDMPGMSHVKACDNAQTAAGFMLANLRAAQTGG